MLCSSHHNRPPHLCTSYIKPCIIYIIYSTRWRENFVILIKLMHDIHAYIPVKKILSHLCTNSCWAASPPPWTIFTARGSKYDGTSWASKEEDTGAKSDGFRTTTFPAATAPINGSKANSASKINKPIFWKTPFPLVVLLNALFLSPN